MIVSAAVAAERHEKEAYLPMGFYKNAIRYTA